MTGACQSFLAKSKSSRISNILMIEFLRMFTGIIRKIGIVSDIKKSDQNRILKIKSDIRCKTGDSIAINGVCATVIKKSPGTFFVELMPETLKRTNLGALKKNSKVNLEKPLKYGDKISGHFVLGHIDGTGIVKAISGTKNYKVIKIKAPRSLRKFIVFKGSISINGVSLTISKVKDDAFEVSLIPYTLTHTNLGDLKINDKVNIEIDVLARYGKI